MITEAIRFLRPNSTFCITNNDYSTLKWNDPDTNPPSLEEVENKNAELQADYDANKYQRDRAAAYPSWQDQLDTIYHQGIDTWKAQIKAIKDQHPKKK